MRADTQTVIIGASAEDVRAFVADPQNLPRWAIGFAKGIGRDEDGGWIVHTASGPIPVDVRTDAALGTVDFVMRPAPGAEAIAYSRAVDSGQGCAYSFTQVQAPGMPDDVFDAQVEALRHELVALKALLEVQCPL